MIMSLVVIDNSVLTSCSVVPRSCNAAVKLVLVWPRGFVNMFMTSRRLGVWFGSSGLGHSRCIVVLHPVRLVLGWVTVCRRVNQGRVAINGPPKLKCCLFLYFSTLAGKRYAVQYIIFLLIHIIIVFLITLLILSKITSLFSCGKGPFKATSCPKWTTWYP